MRKRKFRITENSIIGTPEKLSIVWIMLENVSIQGDLFVDSQNPLQHDYYYLFHNLRHYNERVPHFG